jgi:predicted secreted Zn-dependent protease
MKKVAYQFLMAFLVIYLPCHSHAEVRVDVNQRFYSVTHYPGSTVKQALNNATPYQADGVLMHASTEWNVTWDYWFDERGGGCRIDRVDIRMRVDVGLPRLRSSDQYAQRQFNQYLSALQRHEQTHVQISRNGAYAIERALLQLRPARFCDQLESDAESAAQRAVEVLRAQHSHYDQRTNHGGTEGAFLEY